MRLLDKKSVNTYFTHNPFPFITVLTFVILLILRHNVKNICLDIYCVNYAKTWVSYDTFFPVYDSTLIRENTDAILSIYGKTLVKNIYFGVFYTVIGKK